MTKIIKMSEDMNPTKPNDTSCPEKSQIELKEEKYQKPSYHLYFISSFLIITCILIIFRILINLFELPYLIEVSRDVDFFILLQGFNQNGLLNFYSTLDLPKEIPNWPPYYLYFWYFIFFPFGILPFEVGVYLWDILRLLATSFISFKAQQVFKNKKDLLIFLISITIGYCIDGWFNNVNFLILFFLFLSYLALIKDEMWLSGIFFALGIFKINSVLYLLVLLITRRIKIKHLIFYIIPIFIICLPYIVFPNYLLQMTNNWLHSDEQIQGFLIIDSIIWKAFQPSHLMYIALFIVIILVNIKQERRRNQIRFILFSLLIFYYLYSYITVFLIPLY